MTNETKYNIVIEKDANGFPLDVDYDAGLAVGEIAINRDDNGFPADAALVSMLRENSEI